MPEATVVQFQKKEEAKFICSACGADRGCQCNAPAVPKAVRAAEALKANPEKSDRSIAEEIGASPTTVGKAREELSSSGQLEDGPRVGKDGKARQARRQTTRRSHEQALLDRFPHAVGVVCDTVNNLGDVAVPPALAAEMAALLLPDVREAIKNLKRLEAALTKIVGESMGTIQ
jgi:hypothetical protein